MKKPTKRGRPKKIVGESVTMNIRLPRLTWSELKSWAEAKGISTSDVVRIALAEWMLATSIGQRPRLVTNGALVDYDVARKGASR